MSSSASEEASARSVSYIVRVPPQVNEEVVELLRNMLSYAEAGELQGFVAFAKHVGGEAAHATAGYQAGDFPVLLAAFEDWKFKALWRRNRTDG